MSRTITLVEFSVTVSMAAMLLTGCGRSGPDPSGVSTLSVSAGAVSSTAVGSDGTVYWTWFETEGDHTQVHAAAMEPDGAGIARSTVVDQGRADANMHGQAPAQVNVGPNGHVYVAWTTSIDVPGRRFPASDLLLAVSRDGARTFSNPVTVNDRGDGPPTGHTFHDVAVAGDGTIYVSWIDTGALDASRAAKPATAQGQRHESDAGHMHGHHGSIGDDLPGPEIRVAKSTDGGRSFQPSVVVDRNSCPCCRTSLAVAEDGTVYVAWRKVYDGEIRDMALAVSYDNGTSFADAERIHVDGWQFSGCPHTGPAIAVDHEGSLHAAWYTGVDSGRGLFYSVRQANGFTEPVALALDAPVSQVRMVPAESRGVWLAWEDREKRAVQLAHASQGIVGDLVSTFPGEQPALAAAGGLVSLSLTSKEKVSAYLFRR